EHHQALVERDRRVGWAAQNLERIIFGAPRVRRRLGAGIAGKQARLLAQEGEDVPADIGIGERPVRGLACRRVEWRAGRWGGRGRSPDRLRRQQRSQAVTDQSHPLSLRPAQYWAEIAEGVSFRNRLVQTRLRQPQNGPGRNFTGGRRWP